MSALVFAVDVPTIGAINGPGYHHELALVCDGLVNEVVPAERLVPRAQELAATIMATPRTTRRLTHAVLQRPWKRRLVDDLAFGRAHRLFET